jgi:hypothetical protein
MANRLRSEADVNSADGKTYTLFFGTNACVKIEDELKVNPPTLLKELQSRTRREFRTLVRILLERHHPEFASDGLTPAERERLDELAGDVIDQIPSGELGRAIVCAFHGMTPEQLAAAVKKQPKRPKEKPDPEAAAAAGQPIS